MRSITRSLIIAVLFVAPSKSAFAHGEVAKGAMPEAESFNAAVGEKQEGDLHEIVHARFGAEMEVEVRLTRQLDPPDPILGSAVPFADAHVTIAIANAAGATVGGPITARAEGEAGLYGAHFTRLPSGGYVINVDVHDKDGASLAAAFPVAVSNAPMAGENIARR